MLPRFPDVSDNTVTPKNVGSLTLASKRMERVYPQAI